MYQRASSTLAHLREVSEYAKRLGVTSKIYVTPLNSLKESFYTGGTLFSCLYDKKMKDVFAAGGRYDSLIRENRPRIGSHYEERHAVGFNLSWEKLSRAPKTSGKAFLKKSEEEGHNMFSSTKRVGHRFPSLLVWLLTTSHSAMPSWPVSMLPSCGPRG